MSQKHKTIRGILSRFNESYFEQLEEIHPASRPELVCIACSDSRIVPSLLLALPPGEQFVGKPLGGFLPQDLSSDNSLSGWFSLAVGMKRAPKIIMIAHSDCAAGAVALKYPSVGDLPLDHPEYNNIRSIQDYLFGIGTDLPALSKECMQRADGDEKSAIDLMTKNLALHSIHNLMEYKVCDNQSRTIEQAVTNQKIDVALIYVDLEKKHLEYFDLNDETFKPLTEANAPSKTEEDASCPVSFPAAPGGDPRRKTGFTPPAL